MGLIETMLGAQGGQTKSALGERFGLTEDQVDAAIRQLGPALNQGIKRNTREPSGLDALVGALNSGNHERYLEQPEMLRGDTAVQDGNAILGHIFGRKEVSREVAQRASAKTGIDTSILKQMLPLVATMVMGSLSKNKNKFQQGAAPSGGMLGGLLDADGDGSIADDLFGMFKKLF